MKISTKGNLTDMDLMFLHSILQTIQTIIEYNPEKTNFLMCSNEIVYNSISADGKYSGRLKKLPYAIFVRHVKNLIQANVADNAMKRQERLFPAVLYDIPSEKKAALEINSEDIKIESEYNEETHHFRIKFIDK